MSGRPRGAAGRALLLVGLTAALAGVWMVRPRPAPGAATGAGRRGISPELAEATLDRFERFRAGASGSRLALGGADLSSVLRFALPGILPPGVSEPDVRLGAGEVSLQARVATAAFPDLPALDPVMGMLPDTVSVRLDGALAQFGAQSLVFRVDRIEAAEIPLPERLVPDVLAALGRSNRAGLPRNGLHVPLPAGIDSVYVADDSLVLIAVP